MKIQLMRFLPTLDLDAKLFNNQLIDLEKPVSYYWPSFKQSNKSSILVKHIFSHQSGLYRFKTKLENKDLLNWKKIISILENQDPDHKPGEKTYYHAKTHGYLVGNLIKIISGLSVGQYLKKNITDKKNLNFYFGLEDSQILNVADLSLQKSGTENNTPKDENFNAFNNPEQNIEFYNSQDWRKAEIPSMGGHGNSEAIASIYDYLANDLKNDQKNIINQTNLIFANNAAENNWLIWRNARQWFLERSCICLESTRNLLGTTAGVVHWALQIQLMGLVYLM